MNDDDFRFDFYCWLGTHAMAFLFGCAVTVYHFACSR